MLTRTQARELLDRHGLQPSRALGQNFLVEPNVVRRIAEIAAVGRGDRVVEIGAGLGSLSLALAETGAEVTTVEIDRHLLPVLEESLAGSGVTVVHDDAASLDWDALLGAPAGANGTGGTSASGPATDRTDGWTLVANLPYNVGTNIVLDVLDQVPAIRRLVVMVQQEVADRLVAELPSRGAGIPSVKVAYWATARVLLQVGPDSFLPRPRVDSAVVELVRRPKPAVECDPDALFRLVRAAFGQRRKMLRRSLADELDAEAFENAEVSGALRPEQLDLDSWARLAVASHLA